MNVQAITRRQAEAIHRHDIMAFESCYAATGVVIDPQYATPLKGSDAIGTDISEFLKTFPDLQLRVVNTIDQGPTYAAEIVMSGTHKGALLTPTGEIPPTNRKVEVNVCLVGRFDANGCIAEEHRYYDLAGMLTQLGIVS